MASELLKTKALAARIKEPKVRDFDFGLNLTSVESLIPDLPEPKPQELLDLQEQNKKQRLLQALQKIGGGLEDSSLDFINRENFGGGGVTKSLGNGLYEITYKGGSKTYYTKIYDRETGKNIKKSFGSDKKAAVKSLKEQKADRPKTKFEKLKEVKETKGTKEFQKITDKIDNKFSKIESKGYANLREFRDEMKNLVTKDKFSNVFETKLKLGNYLTDKFIDIEDVNTSKMESALDKYNKVGGKERGTLNKIASEFGVNKETLEGNIQKTGRKKIPIKYGDIYEKRKAVKEKRIAAEKEFSDTSFESKMKGTKAVQKSHMDDLYSKVVRADTLGYAPKKINQVLLKDVDAYLNQLYKNRNKLLKDKPEGYKQAVEEINQKGIKVAQATDGYKSFQIEQPDGKKYQFGVEPGKTIDPTGIVEGKEIKGNVEKVQFEGGKKKTATLTSDPVDQFFFEQNRQNVMKSQAKVTNKQMTKIAKQLESFGFKCGLKDGATCNTPMAYLDDIKKQQTIAKGSGNAAANAAKKLSAGKAIMREFIGPAALTFELALAVPITYLGYKAGLPPARIVADATYGLFGETEKARLKKEAVKAGIDTSEIQKSLDFEKASGAMQSLVQQEGEFRGPDDETLFPQQYEKGEEDFYKSVLGFRNKEGNVNKDVYNQYGSQLKGLRDYIAKTDAATAAERFTGLGTYKATPEEIDANFDMQDGIMAAEGGRINFGAGSGPMPLKIIYIIMDRLRNLKNSTFSNYNQVRMYGQQKGIIELLEPFKNIPNKNRITSAIDDAEELKKVMPDEYKSILDEIIDDTKQFKFKTAHDKQQALEEALPKELKFENLPEEMFPMPNPENPNFIVPYGYPDKNPFQKSRNLTRTEADKFTGKGTRKTYDTFNEKTKQYQEPSKNTLISEEPIDEELESIIRDLDKGDLQ